MQFDFRSQDADTKVEMRVNKGVSTKLNKSKQVYNQKVFGGHI